MTDLSPAVRDRAAQAAREAVIVGRPWEIVPEDHKAELYKMVDAVVSVVAPEIARPLQARIEVLEAALKFIAEDVCTGPSWVKTNCLNEFPSGLCPVCHARAVLAKGAPDVGEETP